MGTQFFKGSLEHVQGTAIFFEELSEKKPAKSKEAEKELKYLCKTDKMMMTRRIFIEPKQI